MRDVSSAKSFKLLKWTAPPSSSGLPKHLALQGGALEEHRIAAIVALFKILTGLSTWLHNEK